MQEGIGQSDVTSQNWTQHTVMHQSHTGAREYYQSMTNAILDLSSVANWHY